MVENKITELCNKVKQGQSVLQVFEVWEKFLKSLPMTENKQEADNRFMQAVCQCC